MNLFASLSGKVREKSNECHNYKPQPFPDLKRKRKPTNQNKSNKRTKSTLSGSNYPYVEQISVVPKMFVPDDI